MTKFYCALFFSLILITGCKFEEDQSAQQLKSDINASLDSWHQAAANADFEQYFDHFSGDSAIFMGTDATERWTVPEFKEYAKPHFDKGQAWDFTPVDRYVYLSEDGQTAWFDESLDTPNLGPARGSGALVKKDGDWMIAHYNLSIPIPNAIADTVVKQVEEALQKNPEQE